MTLSQFRERVTELDEVVDVTRRDEQGNTQILGYWTPYATYAPGAVPLKPLVSQHAVATKDLSEFDPSRDGEFPMGEDSEFDLHPRTAPKPVIRSPEEAKTAVATVPSIRPVPKPSQRKK